MRNAVVLLVLLALCLSACGNSKRTTLSADDVKDGLRAAHFDPQEITLTITSTVKPSSGELGFSDAVVESGVKYQPLKTFVIARRTTVLVFASAEGARQYNAFMNGKGSQIRNTLVVPSDRRVHDALSRLR